MTVVACHVWSASIVSVALLGLLCVLLMVLYGLQPVYMVGCCSKW